MLQINFYTAEQGTPERAAGEVKNFANLVWSMNSRLMRKFCKLKSMTESMQATINSLPKEIGMPMAKGDARRKPGKPKSLDLKFYWAKKNTGTRSNWKNCSISNWSPCLIFPYLYPKENTRGKTWRQGRPRPFYPPRSPLGNWSNSTTWSILNRRQEITGSGFPLWRRQGPPSAPWSSGIFLDL